MTSSPDCFVHRVGKLPLVSVAANNALSQYQRAKNFNGILNASLSVIENTLNFAINKTQPIVQKPLDKLSTAACRGLDRVEGWIPAIQMTPDEIREAGVEYYEGSYVKRGVDVTRRVGERVRDVKRRASEVVRKIPSSLNSSFDYCELLVDTYIAEDEDLYSEQESASTSTMGRVGVVGVKVKRGLGKKAARQMDRSRAFYDLQWKRVEHIQITIGDMWRWTAAKFDITLKNGTGFYRLLEQQAKEMKTHPDLIVLRLIQGYANVCTFSTNKMVGYTSGRLPEVCSRPLESAASQINDIGSAVNNAASMTDLKTEARNRIQTGKEAVIDAVDHLAERIPPFTWMAEKEKNHSE